MYHFSNTDTLNMIYFVYFHSIMKYGFICWSNSKSKKDLLIMKEGCENYEKDLLIYFLHGAESFLRS
jgi:hypothetical protein